MEIKDRQGNIILSDKGQDNMLERLYRTVGGVNKIRIAM